MSETLQWNGTDLANEIQRRTGTNVLACFQCHKCSTGCPIGPDMDLLSSQIMRLIHLGREAEVLESKAIWLCASCEACTTRCPQGIDIAGVMDALRILAVERKAAVGDGHGKQFNRSFLGSVRRHGRVFEAGMLAVYKLRSGDFFTDVGKVPQMLAKGKLAFFPGAAALKKRSARYSNAPKRRNDNSEIRILSRLQPGIDRMGFRLFHPRGVRCTGHRVGRHSQLGLLRIHAGACLKRLASRGLARVEPAKSLANEQSRNDRLRILLCPAANGKLQSCQRSGRAPPHPAHHRQSLRRRRACASRARRACKSFGRGSDPRRGAKAINWAARGLLLRMPADPAA